MRNEVLRSVYKHLIMSSKTTADEKVEAMYSLSSNARNNSISRIKNYCVISGRSRSVYRKFKISRILIRELGLNAQIVGLTKATW